MHFFSLAQKHYSIRIAENPIYRGAFLRFMSIKNTRNQQGSKRVINIHLAPERTSNNLQNILLYNLTCKLKFRAKRGVRCDFIIFVFTDLNAKFRRIQQNFALFIAALFCLIAKSQSAVALLFKGVSLILV